MEEYKITHWFPVGRGGICHALFPEQGLVRPGMSIVGSDSHTCTYGAVGAFSTGMGATDIAAAMAIGETWIKVPETILMRYTGQLSPYVSGKDIILHTLSVLGVNGALYDTLEFDGEAIRTLSMDGRFTICNMAIEVGAKNGIIAPDEVTKAYLENRCTQPFSCYTSDSSVNYKQQYIFDAGEIPPLIAKPHSPDNVSPVSQVRNVRVDQVVVGSCTNGRLEDLQEAASILQGQKIAKHTRMLVIPATQSIYLEAIQRGIIACFVQAGAIVAPPTCGPCFGGHMGLLADKEVAVSTTNRNFPCRMGAQGSQVYLASPMTAAACAIAGEIIDPRSL